MDESVGAAAKRRGARTSRWTAVLLVLVAAGLGGWGLWLATPPELGATWNYWTNLLYEDLQLFVLQPSPLPPGVVASWQLEVGRFLAPATTVFAVVVAASDAVRDQLRWMWRRFVRPGYAVVIGTTPEARSVVAAKRGDKQRVYEIPTGDLATLKRVGLKRGARALYFCVDDRTNVSANLAIALPAADHVVQHMRRARRREATAALYVQVTDPDLALGLTARRLSAEYQQPVLEFFTLDQIAASAYVQGEDLSLTAAQEILVAGVGAFGRAIVVAYALRWSERHGRAGEKLSVILVDPHASRIARELTLGHSIVADVCTFTSHDSADVTTFLRHADLRTPYRSYICFEDEHEALRTALTAVKLWYGGPGSIVVRLSKLAQRGPEFLSSRLDHIGGRLRVADVTSLASQVLRSDPDSLRVFAMAAHHRYLQRQLGEGKLMGSEEALKPWDQLAETYRRSNRDQVHHFATKLQAIGCAVAPRPGPGERFELSPFEVERLAELEHARWRAEREAGGWRYGVKRNNRRKRHPDLVDWSALPETSRNKDRDAVSNLYQFAEALDDLGLQIIRLLPPASGSAQRDETLAAPSIVTGG